MLSTIKDAMTYSRRDSDAVPGLNVFDDRVKYRGHRAYRAPPADNNWYNDEWWTTPTWSPEPKALALTDGSELQEPPQQQSPKYRGASLGGSPSTDATISPKAEPQNEEVAHASKAAKDKCEEEEAAAGDQGQPRKDSADIEEAAYRRLLAKSLHKKPAARGEPAPKRVKREPAAQTKREPHEPTSSGKPNKGKRLL